MYATKYTPTGEIYSALSVPTNIQEIINKSGGVSKGSGRQLSEGLRGLIKQGRINALTTNNSNTLNQNLVAGINPVNLNAILSGAGFNDENGTVVGKKTGLIGYVGNKTIDGQQYNGFVYDTSKMIRNRIKNAYLPDGFNTERANPVYRFVKAYNAFVRAKAQLMKYISSGMSLSQWTDYKHANYIKNKIRRLATYSQAKLDAIPNKIERMRAGATKMVEGFTNRMQTLQTLVPSIKNSLTQVSSVPSTSIRSVIMGTNFQPEVSSNVFAEPSSMEEELNIDPGDFEVISKLTAEQPLPEDIRQRELQRNPNKIITKESLKKAVAKERMKAQFKPI